ncbi:hypothetical protein HDE_07957 [Halotydeus destructor]|nr:hypothetical protein HDE_07957 [Halotydeus destructor]
MDIEDEEESAPSLVADLGPGSESRGLDYLPQTLLARYLVQAGYLPQTRLRLVQAPLGPLSKRTPKRARDNGKPVMGSEFLGKRMGSEFLGKRMGSEFLGKRMGSEFLGRRKRHLVV